MMSFAPLDCRAMLGTVLRGSGASYYIDHVVGEGGQGWVFRASYDDADGYPVVVKVLRPDSATKDALDRFRREAEILRRLSQTNPSPFIVRFYDHGEAEFPLPLGTGNERARLPFTVMEYVHGEALYTVVERQRGEGLAIKRVRRILREVHKALEVVHAQGVVHRDLKPSNILLASEAGREVAKVTDFGLVKVIDLRATSTQSLAGVSLSYAPPEQYEPGNPRVGPWTDVFSYAAIVFELLAGREAYPANMQNPFEALRLIASGKRPKLAELVGALPSGLRERADLIQRLDLVLDAAMSPDPNARPQTIGAIWEPVEAILRDADARIGEVSGAYVAREPSGAYVAAPPAPPVAGSAPISAVAPIGRRASTPPAKIPSLPPTGAPIAPVPTHVAARVHRPDPSDLRAWSFRVLSPGTPGAQVRGVVFDDDLREAITLGSAGLVQWSSSGWTSIPLAIGMMSNELRAIARVGPSGYVLAGEGGVVAFLHAGALWDVRRFPDGDVVFHGVAADPTGARVLAVGQRISRGHAVAVEVLSSGWRRTFEITDQAPLRSVSWADDRVAYACGDAGALVRIDDAGLARIGWERTGHLRAIVANRHPATARVVGAFAVGTGGHALAVAAHPSGRAEIEKVTTTQDLLAVDVASDGAPWACSANARVLRRDAVGAWRRIPADLPTAAHLVGIAARWDRVLIVAEDATVLEGNLGR